MASIFSETFAVVTGASQGIGRAIALELARNLKDNSFISLVARSEGGLNETKSLISLINSNISVSICPLDLSKPDINNFEKFIDENVAKAPDVQSAIIFHNAGQIGTLNATTELTDLQTWHDYYDLNFFSTVLLNSTFVKKLRGKVKNLAVINVTSLCGRKPFPNLAMYGSAKAARDLFFQVFAEEEKDILVLNYSPGPVETNMVEEIVTNVKDTGIKSMFTNLRETKTILTPEQTVQKLFDILKTGDFKSGDVLDYFDRI